MKDSIERIQFYKEIYTKEVDRATFLDSKIKYPTTVVVGLVGAFYFCFSNYFTYGINSSLGFSEWVFILVSSMFLISVLFTLYFLFWFYHGFYSRKYKYLPYSRDLVKFEIDSMQHFKSCQKNEKGRKAKTNAQKNANKYYNKIMLNYYVDCGDFNQRMNDKRESYFRHVRSFLIIDVIFLLIIGLILIIKII